MYEKIKKWYKQGLWSKTMVLNAYNKGIISEEQYKTIIKESEEK